MALVVADRVKETTTTTGTGAISLAGAETNFVTFSSVLSNSDTTYYAIIDDTNNAFEVGLGTFSSSGNSITRTTVLASSNSGSAVDLSAGTKEVFVNYPAGKSVYLDSSGQLVIGGTAVTSTAAELNILDGVTASTAEINLLDGSSSGTIVNAKGVVYGGAGEVNGTTLQIAGTSITSTAAELNILDGVTASTAELNLVDGSSAGTIVNSKAVIYGSSGEVNATTLQIAGNAITSTAAEINILDGVTSTATEINYVDITTLGTSQASKAVTADANAKVKFVGTTSLAEIIEKVDIPTSTSGTINFDFLTQAVQFYNTNQAANRTINFRGDGSNSLNSIMATGESMTCAVLMKQGGSAYYLNTYQVDGSSVTPEWSGGTAPSAGNANSVDSYVFTVVKTGDAAFTVFASQTQFA